jgi:hypothetical protein
VRPSIKSLLLSLVVCVAALYFALFLFEGDFLFPLAASIGVAGALTWYRMRNLSQSLPSPYGNGKLSVLNAASSLRSGILIIVAGAALTLGLMATVYFLPPLVFFTLVFGLAGGLPLGEVVFFALVTRLELKSGRRIMAVTEEADENGKEAYVKTLELAAPT